MPPLRDRFETAKSALVAHVLRFWPRWVVFAAALLAGAGTYHLYVAAPADFPAGVPVVISTGDAAGMAAQQLANDGIVRSPTLLRLLWRVTGNGNSIHSGAYRFEAPLTVFSVAARVAAGNFGISPNRITFPEGSTVRDMAAKISAAFPEVRASDFISAAGPYEGYLFPDTYVFASDATAADMVTRMRANFDTRTVPLTSSIEASGHSLADIITMASLIEKEGRTPPDKAMIAGILWNRISKNMPLQVDAVFGYIYDRSTFSPTYSQLKVDSPFNTYTQPGLPPSPIDNPGLESIEAALNPAKTTYLFYLTGSDGQMHYATTYAQHLANERAYLGMR